MMIFKQIQLHEFVSRRVSKYWERNLPFRSFQNSVEHALMGPREKSAQTYLFIFRILALII